MPLPGFEEVNANLEDFLERQILLWNPNITHHEVVKDILGKCVTCGLPYTTTYWNDGSSTSKEPRVIHSINNIVYLVSAVYVCCNKHRLLAHDPIIQQCFPTKSVIPFVLFHKTGFTRVFAEMCLSLVRNGMNFYAIESLVMERRMQTYARGVSHFHLYRQFTHGQGPSEVNFASCILSKCPSNTAISALFVTFFLDSEQKYLYEIEKIRTGSTLSFDHTFKVASNIGYRRIDNVWVTQYDSLFIVMTEEGKIVKWQFTKGTSFEQVRTVLEDLKSLAQEQGEQIKVVFTDDCCKLRQKIVSVFGSNTAAKLDLFHAVQRITKALRKRHPLHHQCLLDLRQVFRQNGDSGERRLADTPPPREITPKLTEWCQKWKHMSDSSGNKIWTSATDGAVEHLQKHVTAGCLSALPPGGGTNKNERFHRFLNSFFNKSKIGILLAYALMTVLIHTHNVQMIVSGRRIISPIIVNPCELLNDHRHARPIGIVNKHYRRQQEDDHWEIDLSEREMDMQVVVSVFSTSIKKLNITKALKKMNLKQMVEHVYCFQPYDIGVDSAVSSHHKTALEKRLSDYGLVLSISTKDGNCFFQSVATNIVQAPDIWKSTLKDLGVIQSVSDGLPGDLPQKLRQVFIYEITGYRQPYYKNFVTGAVDFCSEARRFLETGFYDSEVGNLMPLAMATALQSHFVLFKADNNTPLYITPELDPTQKTIFLVYYSEGSGHYDAAIPFNTCQQITPQLPTKCSCGVNRDLKACLPSVRYPSRCPCLRSGRGCTSLCRCRNCQNPNGCRPARVKVCRERRAHPLQTQIQKSETFARLRGEKLSESCWSDFENIVVHEIILQETDESESSILKLYSDVVYYSKASFCIFPLPDSIVFREKSITQMVAKLRHIKK